MKNIGNILKQAQQMQERMAKMQEELSAVSVTGNAGGGLVVITMNGKQELLKVRIDPKLMQPEDVEMLEDLVAAAFNDAQRRLLEITQQQLSQVTGGLNIPGLKMP
ncbi:MAG: YbaB/EbfC family nucleoid-associated protein [Magnetococcales bacterium]|nr:YbaB/EbfC family nucleoid-associated protein [Magnetococcales bacterium]MBF0323083.1 YbaB/EbfC family nucleoid-associated protein [Magnetococcales bacterium]